MFGFGHHHVELVTEENPSGVLSEFTVAKSVPDRYLFLGFRNFREEGTQPFTGQFTGVQPLDSHLLQRFEGLTDLFRAKSNRV